MGESLSKILLGVSGSIAAYRACDLARDLMRAGHSVTVCLTESASRFVSPALFEALTGTACSVDTFEEPVPGRMAHIDLARSADLLVIAPATANTISNLARGTGGNMLTTLALAFEGPILIAPAMNPTMYRHEATQLSIAELSRRGAIFVEPTEGDVACGENGQGKLASNLTILAEAESILRGQVAWIGKSILITSGPTREPIDDVRFLTNRSSGKMGAAVARAAVLAGASVTVVTGPVSVILPAKAKVIYVQTALEMLEAVRAEMPNADLLVGCAAVSDYRPRTKSAGKLRRSTEDLQLDLIPNPDILSTIAAEFPACPIVGFAAEPDQDLEVAREKIRRKGLRAIAHNDIGAEGIGFESDENSLTLITASGEASESGRLSKLGCAIWLLRQIKERVLF